MRIRLPMGTRWRRALKWSPLALAALLGGGHVAGMIQNAYLARMPLSETVLDAQRGGFVAANALRVNFGLDMQTFVDGRMALRTVLNLPGLSLPDTGQPALTGSGGSASANGAVGKGTEFQRTENGFRLDVALPAGGQGRIGIDRMVRQSTGQPASERPPAPRETTSVPFGQTVTLGPDQMAALRAGKSLAFRVRDQAGTEFVHLLDTQRAMSMLVNTQNNRIITQNTRIVVNVDNFKALQQSLPSPALRSVERALQHSLASGLSR